MKSQIAEIETFAVSYPVVGRFKFFESPTGEPLGRPCVVVKITDEAGHVGWGQSVPSNTWSYETLESVRTTIDGYLAPALIGQDAFQADAIRRIMDRVIAPSFSTGQPICKAGIDLALFDLTGRLLGRSAAQRWGRTGRDRITLSWTLNPKSLDGVADDIAEAHSRGYHNFNVKVAPDPEFDLELCRQVRRLAPESFVWVDANGGYDVETALSVAAKFADLGIAAFEQPLPANRLEGFRKLKRQSALPILMDEPIVSRTDLEEFHRLGLLDGVTMKVARCGGLGEACRVLDYVEQEGLLFFGSGLSDPDLSLAASLALFGAYDLATPAALNGPQFFDVGILKEPIVVEADQAVVPAGCGLGVDVDEAALAKLQTW